MQTYQTNCAYTKESLQYLDDVEYNKFEQLWAGIQLMTLGGFTPDFETKKQIASGSANHWVQMVREDYYRKCLNM